MSGNKLPKHITASILPSTSSGMIHCHHCGTSEALKRVWDDVDRAWETIETFRVLHQDCKNDPLTRIKGQLALMQSAYDEKRTDVAELLGDIIDGKLFDPRKVEKRFVIITIPNIDTVGPGYIRYDTLTTLARWCDCEGNPSTDDYLQCDYED